MKKITFFFVALFFTHVAAAQFGRGSQWSTDGNGYYSIKNNEIILFDIEKQTESVVISSQKITPENVTSALKIKDFSFSEDLSKTLIFTNSKRVWRYETRGDYWVFDTKNNTLKQLGKGLPEASLLFAKFSPDAKKVAYVSKNNIYVEDLASSIIKQVTTTDGKAKLINGTFDWAYEEEFACRDGFQWSADSRSIAYWQIDASTIRDFYMINTTDSLYAFNVPVEYPKVGESPSACRVGVVDVSSAKTVWMNVPGDNRQHYIPRMEWAMNSNELIIQQLNRRQNQSKLFIANAKTGEATKIQEETDQAWVDVRDKWGNGNGWNWIEKGKAFVWVSEKDGWVHLYKITRDGKKETLLTQGNYDIIDPLLVDEAKGFVYFTASPTNATEKYLYRVALNNGTSKAAERLTPQPQEGTHSYEMSPNGKFAYHSFSNYYAAPMKEWIYVDNHNALTEKESIALKFDPTKKAASNVEFFQVTTEDGTLMDGWMAKPTNFDPTKKYPVLFMVYGEPAGQTVVNRFGTGKNNLYDGDMAADGYIYMSVEGRGAPAPKGRAWRKAIYRNIGIINIRDQAMACKKLIETHNFIDSTRIAVHGWSGGGSSTLNLLFQYPDLYQTGISVAAVGNQLTYDNIYQERYMGLPQDGDLEGFVNGSPVTHAKNLRGNLLYIHGTGDDNVHYQNAEMLINELVKHNKQFQLMSYPNRSHGISEGEGTRKHLNTLFTNFLKQNCPPGGR